MSPNRTNSGVGFGTVKGQRMLPFDALKTH
jgi:hypothetical protein